MFGHFSEESIEAFIQMNCEEKGLNYSETFDFGRCQRPDGSFYGTRGMCKPPSKTVATLSKGRTVAERNRNARQQKAINQTMDRMKGKPVGGSSWVQKGQERKHLSGQKSDRVLGSSAAKDTIREAANRIKGSGGGGNLSDAQLRAFFAKTGGGKGLKGGFGRR
jgi:hypothetical protein